MNTREIEAVEILIQQTVFSQKDIEQMRIEICDNGDVFLHTGNAYPICFSGMLPILEEP